MDISKAVDRVWHKRWFLKLTAFVIENFFGQKLYIFLFFYNLNGIKASAEADLRVKYGLFTEVSKKKKNNNTKIQVTHNIRCFQFEFQ